MIYMEEKNPVKQARLDYFLLPNSLTDIVETIDIKPGYRSDHSIVEMQININKFSQGSGIWKFNNSLLKNQDYLNLINKVIIEEKLEDRSQKKKIMFLHSKNKASRKGYKGEC